ncbi:hypothetical protein GGR52DRAFT_468564 [Hypoxylon sp. FL1284]|nr:hypothetical protein GGR52DRAFT_468564 [Hypoxylon sp. FL1284]
MLHSTDAEGQLGKLSCLPLPQPLLTVAMSIGADHASNRPYLLAVSVFLVYFFFSSQYILRRPSGSGLEHLAMKTHGLMRDTMPLQLERFRVTRAQLSNNAEPSIHSSSHVSYLIIITRTHAWPLRYGSLDQHVQYFPYRRFLNPVIGDETGWS